MSFCHYFSTVFCKNDLKNLLALQLINERCTAMKQNGEKDRHDSHKK